jgi:membrane protease YdiL (CAAX protease family)
MIETLAHITPPDTPMIWLAALGGFVAGVAVTYAFVARKWK